MEAEQAATDSTTCQTVDHVEPGGSMPAPDDLPRSPTGRVPQWVIDEAAGRTSAPDPWRSTVTPLDEYVLKPGPSRPTSRSRRRQNVIAIVVLLVVFGAPRLLNSTVAARWIPGFSSGADVVAAQQPDGSTKLVPRSSAWPTPDLGASPQRLLPTAWSPSGPFALMDDSSPEATHWSPCRPISIVVNEQGAPANFLGDVQAVAMQLQALTGLSISVEGTTDELASSQRSSFQPDRYGDRWVPVLVGWTNDANEPELQGDVVGLGSPYSVPINEGPSYYVTGTVMLDEKVLTDTMPDGSPAYLAVLRHEFGHVLGLNHIDDATQLMAADLTSVSDFADGDRAGLALLGSGSCSSGI